MLSKERKREFETKALSYLDSLYNMAFRLVRDRTEAEDLVQETYLKAYRFFHRFQPNTNLKAWLFKILMNTFINRYHQQQRDREVIENWDWDRFITEERFDASEREILDKVISKVVVEALEKIPVDFRTVVILADLEDFSYREIAEIVGCPIGTVMSRLYRGRRLLRKFLRDYAIEQGIISEKSAEEEKEVGKTKGAVVTDLESYRKKRRNAV